LPKRGRRPAPRWKPEVAGFRARVAGIRGPPREAIPEETDSDVLLRIVRREEAESLFSLTNPNPSSVVEVHHRGRNPADRGQRNDAVSCPLKVISPPIDTRIEQRNELAGLGIVGFDPVRLTQIAAGARPRQVFRARSSAARPWHDVLDVKRRPLQRLVHPAILAPPRCAPTNLTLNFVPGGHSGLRPNT